MLEILFSFSCLSSNAKYTRAKKAIAGGFAGAKMPNVPSGGTTTRTELGQFLSNGGNAPEKQALLTMIGELAQFRD